MTNDEFVIPRRLINSDREETPRSLLDLIEQGPFDLDTAAWWMSHVTNGASWIVGSGPGGIGKSTTMRSFLSVVPGDRAFAIAMPGEIPPLADQKRCTIALELSDHRPARLPLGSGLCVTFSTYRRRDISLWGMSTRIRWKRRVNRSLGRVAFPRNSSITSISSHSSGWKVMNADKAGGSGIRRRGGF